jgi:hypothetical protein
MDPLLDEAFLAYDAALDRLQRYAVREHQAGYEAARIAVTRAKRDLESLGVVSFERSRSGDIGLCRKGVTRQRREAKEARLVALATDRTCTVCGTVFRPTQIRGRLAELCGDTCRAANKARHSQVYYAELTSARRALAGDVARSG